MPDKEAIAAEAIAGALAAPGTVGSRSPEIGYRLVVRGSTTLQ